MRYMTACLVALIASICLSRAAAGADGAVVVREAPLYKNRSGMPGTRSNDVICTLEPGDVVLPSAPQGMLLCQSFLWKACDTKFRTPDPQRYPVRAPSCGKKTCVDGWVDQSAVEVFSYDPDFLVKVEDIAGVPVTLHYLKSHSYSDAAMRKLDELRFRDFKPPTITNMFPLSVPAAKVWPAIIEFLSTNSMPFEVVDKASGLITTKPIRDPLRDTMVCATALAHDYVVTFNVFLKDKGEACDLRVNATYKAARSDETITCYSNGTLEKWVAEGVKATLGGT